MLNGTNSRFVSAVMIPGGSPGGSLAITVHLVPTNTGTAYPANGEPIATILLAAGGTSGGLNDSRCHVPAGVKPDNVILNDNLGHFWTWDSGQGTMGTLRNYTAIGATPSEHSTGNYTGNEASATIRATFFFPLYGSMSR